MDRLPLVLENENHDSLPILTEVFQDAFWRNTYPENVAHNYQKYKVDSEYEDLQNVGLETVKILEFLETQNNDIARTEEEIMRGHAAAMIQKERNLLIFEEIRLERCPLFQKLSNHAVEAYELIQTSDLFPNVIEQYLDFTFNPFLKVCAPPKLPPKEVPVYKVKQKICASDVTPEVTPSFRAEPNHINFHNYELNRLYKKKFKLRNVTEQPQNFSYYDALPKNSPFTLRMLTDSCRLAPGMAAEFLVTFHSQTYQNYTEIVKFRTRKGVDLNVVLSNSRDAPKLICYVINPLLPWDIVVKPGPGSRNFNERRRTALNFTIDCGTCLLGSCSMVSVVTKNVGEKGKFFITAENEWVFCELNESPARSHYLQQGRFSIFPTYFEIEKGETCEIFVLYTPEDVGVYNEKLYVICDNNSHQEIEILGDCVLFSSNFLKVNMYIFENTFAYNHKLLTITISPYDTSAFIFSIVNNSPIVFSYFWALKTHPGVSKYRKMNPDWIDVVNNTKCLPSFSKTDVTIQLTPKTKEEDVYYIFISLILKNIPAKSISGNVKEDEFKFTDLSIVDLEIICTVATLPPAPLVSNEIEEKISTNPRVLNFSKPLLQFGVLPKGVMASKRLSIKNLSENDVDWKLIEISSREGNHFCNNLGGCEGTLKKRTKIKFTYTVEATRETRWVSFLLLFAKTARQEFSFEDFCLVTYEVADVRISIYTPNKMALLCPQSYIYVGIPSIQTIYVYNAGLTIGCFYFLKPRGRDSERVRLRFHPQSGVVPTCGTVEVKVEITGLESGVFEDIFVPCFVGNRESLIGLNVVCTVATINVHFYLPNLDGTYCRFLWPSKDVTPNWDLPIEVGEDDQRLPLPESYVDSQECQPSIDEDLINIISTNSIAITYPTTKVKTILVKRASKMTFYIENLTPLRSHFNINPTNYGPHNECFNHILVKSGVRTPACLDGHGIVVEPIRPFGDIVPYEVVVLELWIYANTFGKYLEEVMVEVNDLTPFCFNLLIEVVGLPIEFPFARNTTLQCPTIRFENVAYSSDNTSKSFTVANISSIPVQINWYVFNKNCPRRTSVPPFNILLEIHDENMKLVVPRKYYGCETCRKCVDVSPSYSVLEKQATTTITVTVSPSGYLRSSTRTSLEYSLLGFIGLKNSHVLKENYYKRESGLDFDPAKVLLLVTLEVPVMQVDLSSDDTTIDIFVNDILISGQKFPEVYLILRNNDVSTVYFSIEIEKPFRIIRARTIPTGITDCDNLVLHRYECLQLMIGCHFTNTDLLDYGKLLYKHDTEGNDITENFTSVISKDLNISQRGSLRQVRLHYPHVFVKPLYLKFGHCLIYHTKKAMFTVYNMTGASVSFEIYKTSKCDVFEVHPNCAQIDKSTGANKQFVDISVYFTPRDCKFYMENLRIATNIPDYYIDVSLRGHGSNNEKFLV